MIVFYQHDQLIVDLVRNDTKLPNLDQIDSINKILISKYFSLGLGRSNMWKFE